MADRAAARVEQVLAQPEAEPLDRCLEEEICRLVRMAQAKWFG